MRFFKRGSFVVIAIAVAIVLCVKMGLGYSKAEGILLSDAGLEGDIWNDGTWSYWIPEDGDWSYQSVDSFLYSSDEWITADEELKCMKYGFSTGSSFYFTQVVDKLEAGIYEIKADAMGADSSISVYFNGEAADKTDLTGWNNWLTSTSKFTLAKDCENVVVGVVITGTAESWGYFDNISLSLANETEEDSAVEAGIYIEKVAGMQDGFIKGVDISSFQSIIDSGASFKDWDGNVVDEQGFFDLLAGAGVNYVRLRVWNDPYDSTTHGGYGGGTNDITKAVTMGKYATNAGMKVLIDFHYSDFWADPGKQAAPKAWTDCTIDEKVKNVSEFTTSSLKTLLDASVDVGMVQIGNETNNGVAGETSWENMCKIFSSGSSAVRKIADDNNKDIKIAVHFTNPETAGRYTTYAANLDNYGVDYDVFASSYYPYWHGTLSNLTTVLNDVASKYNKEVMVAETSYARTYDDGDGHLNTISATTTGADLNYNISVQGQASEVRDVMQAVADIDNNAGIGMFYWEPAWIPVEYAYDDNGILVDDIYKSNQEKWETYGSGWASSYSKEYDPDDAGKWYGGASWDNQAMFDFEGNPLESLKVFSYVTTGTKTEAVFEKFLDIDVTVEYGQDIVLPSTVTANFNTGDTKEVDVVWEKIADKSVGSYQIKGTAVYEDVTYDVVCKLTILPVNELLNPDFENGDDGSWTIDGTGASITKNESSNVKTGDYCLHFWSDADYEYTVTQTVTGLENGYYNLKGYLQGGDCEENDTFSLNAATSEKEYSANGTVTSWQEWDEIVLENILVTDNTLKISIKANATAGCWGSWDDFYLSAVESDETEETEETEEPEEPTSTPTEEATEEPTSKPTEEVSEEPTSIPTEEVSEEPTSIPTEEVSEEPTNIPTEEVTEEPTEKPKEDKKKTNWFKKLFVNIGKIFNKFFK